MQVIQSNHTHVIPVVPGTFSYDFKNALELRDSDIIGMFIRRQSTNNDKYSSSGNLLIRNEHLDSGFARFKYLGTDRIFDYPLEHLSFDSDFHKPGVFAEVKFSKGLDISTSTIVFKCPEVVAGDLEIVFITNVEC